MNEVVEMKIRFKDPDAIGDAVSALCKPAFDKLVAAGMDEDEASESAAYSRERDKWKKYFEYGDYGCVEFAIKADGTITGRLVPIDEWD